MDKLIESLEQANVKIAEINELIKSILEELRRIDDPKLGV